uniref:Hydrocephalus-inducing n=1 Tax=Lygus hesperus TaxID=30085 RepID=A0A0A9YB47_LYGHE
MITLTVVTVPSETSKTHETVGIYVEDNDPAVQERGLLVDLTARPATPGITCDLSVHGDIATIFEEQQVVVRLDQYDKTLRAFAKDDRTFTFGTVLVKHRVEERFRIANSSPLPCTVHVQIQPASLGSSASFALAMSSATINNSSNNYSSNGNSSAVKNTPKPEGYDLGNTPSGTLYTTQLTLPPFESRFVTVGFTPSSMQKFDARFVALVENGTDPKTNMLLFSFTG